MASSDYKEVLAYLVRQIEMGEYRDEHGHDLRLNDAYLKARELLGPPIR